MISSFIFSFTEAVNLYALATRTGKRLTYDAEKMIITTCPMPAAWWPASIAKDSSRDWKRPFTAAKKGGVKNYFVEMDLNDMKASYYFRGMGHL